jgi:hypothetical protein
MDQEFMKNRFERKKLLKGPHLICFGFKYLPYSVVQGTAV